MIGVYTKDTCSIKTQLTDLFIKNAESVKSPNPTVDSLMTEMKDLSNSF